MEGMAVYGCILLIWHRGRASPVFRQIGESRGQGEGISMKEYIKNRVHELYWNDNINCARTAIICLSELFETAIEQQIIWSAVGLHGAGGYRAQCGLVEGNRDLSP